MNDVAAAKVPVANVTDDRYPGNPSKAGSAGTLHARSD
jgi:hypothetical protein